MQVLKLYDILKSRGYINHELETNLQSARENQTAIIHAALEKDRENVFKTYYDESLWLAELSNAQEEYLEGNIASRVEYIF